MAADSDDPMAIIRRKQQEKKAKVAEEKKLAVATANVLEKSAASEGVTVSAEAAREKAAAKLKLEASDAYNIIKALPDLLSGDGLPGEIVTFLKSDVFVEEAKHVNNEAVKTLATALQGLLGAESMPVPGDVPKSGKEVVLTAINDKAAKLNEAEKALAVNVQFKAFAGGLLNVALETDTLANLVEKILGVRIDGEPFLLEKLAPANYGAGAEVTHDTQKWAEQLVKCMGHLGDHVVEVC